MWGMIEQEAMMTTFKIDNLQRYLTESPDVRIILCFLKFESFRNADEYRKRLRKPFSTTAASGCPQCRQSSEPHCDGSSPLQCWAPAHLRAPHPCVPILQTQTPPGRHDPKSILGTSKHRRPLSIHGGPCAQLIEHCQSRSTPTHPAHLPPSHNAHNSALSVHMSFMQQNSHKSNCELT